MEQQALLTIFFGKYPLAGELFECVMERLRAEFPALHFTLAHKASEVPADVADVDVLISFGVELKDEFYPGQRAASRPVDASAADPQRGGFG